MLSFYYSITKISAILTLFYILTVLFVLSYFIYLKYCTWRDIKEACITKRFCINKENIINSLRIKSMVYNFIIFLSTSEVITTILLGVAEIGRYDLNIVSGNPINISNSCVIRDPNLIGLVDKSTFFVNRILSLGYIICSLFPIIMALFHVILRIIYINYPYKKYIRKYIIYIIMQFVVKICLSSFMQTRYIAQLLYFPLGVFDVTVYTSTSHKFYLLLKGLMNEARINSNINEFYKRRHTVNRFFKAQVLTMILLSIMLTVTFLIYISVALDIISYNPCFLTYISLGLIKDIEIPEYTQKIAFSVANYCRTIELSICLIGELLLNVLYLILALKIISILFRRKYTHNSQALTHMTAPLMKAYRRSAYPTLYNQ